MTIQELIDKSILKPYPVRDNMDGTYSIKIKTLKENAVKPEFIVKYLILNCNNCGKSCVKRIWEPSIKTYCSRQCHGIAQRKNEYWKKQKAIGTKVKYTRENPGICYYGYLYWTEIFRDENDKLIRRKCFMHRMVAEEKIGRPLTRDDHVHHIDMNKKNNHPDNLWVCSSSKHKLAHHSFNELCAEGMNKPIQFGFNIETGKYYLITKGE